MKMEKEVDKSPADDEQHIVNMSKESISLTLVNVNNEFCLKNDKRKINHQHNFRIDNETNENQNANKKPVKLKKAYTSRHFELEKNKIPITPSNVHFLAVKEPNTILITILNTKWDFSTFFKHDLKPEILSHMFIILGKICKSDMLKNLYKFLENIKDIINDILTNIQRYLMSFQNEKVLKEIHLDSIYFLIIFLVKYQSFMPSLSSDLKSVILPLLVSIKEKYLKTYDYLYHFVSDKLKDLLEQHEGFFNHDSFSEKEKYSPVPSESFRLLPVLPTAKDINSPCLFLHPNVVKGQYEDTEHYLDVQYRLLREDYIKDLRDGVSEYLNLKKNKSFNHCKNVRLYNDVHVESECIVNNKLLHLLQFPNKRFSKINWGKSKRFLTGSLLCMSLDDFQTMLFASVSKRDVKNLAKGLLCVQFEESSNTVMHLNPSMSFVVIETTAYFEAYRHNLAALLEITSETLPLKNYIISVKNSVSKPRYLKGTTTYDMRPLLLPLHKDFIKISKGLAKYEFPTNSNAAKSVKVLDDNSWPTATNFNLDNSQYLALKSAATREFSIIQGPPGTGKTHIGLRIVQLLLHNLDKWFDQETNLLPILVVCYTNHALDQFLEGLLLFTSKLVRIGGRSSSEDVLKFQIHTLREKAIKNKTFPSDFCKQFGEKKKEINSIISDIVRYKNTLYMYSNTVISEFKLQKQMPVNHFKTLKERCSKLISNENTYTIHDWLGIQLNKENLFKTDQTKCDKIKLSPFELNEELENEEEDDIEYIENQRNIEFYDPYDVFVERKIGNNSTYIDLNCSEWSDSNELKAKSSKEQQYEMKEYVINSLEYYTAMSEDEAMQVKQVWNLMVDQRWRLYKFWIQKCTKEVEDILWNLQEKLKKKLQEIEELKIEEDLYLLLENHVVGMTTCGAAKHRHLIQKLNPAILIVEEAAEILESHIVTSLAPKTQHVILIGDQQQLRPSPTVHMLAVQYNMNISLFERMVNNGVDYCRLSLQHRMRPEISALIVPHIYRNLENHELVTQFENIKGVTKNVFFLSHSFKELPVKHSKSKVNDHEAKFIIKLCKYLLLQGYDPSQITVLTTYSGQLFALKSLATDDVKKVHFTVVDNYQGEENEIILISFVRSNNKGSIGFLKVSNRVCVALSRAKKGLFCIGNFDLLAEKCSLWENIGNTLKESQSIGSSMSLKCQNHPDTITEVKNDKDFEKVPDGGCYRKCESCLPCGHPCLLFCHPFDQSHEHMKCEKPCMRTCERNHPCDKKCFKKCFCEIVIKRKLKKCGHIVREACGKLEEEIICRNICKKMCERQHLCEKKCYQRCYCEVLVDRTLKKCSHTVKDLCGKPEERIKCKEPCTKKCEREHLCEKKCFEDCFCKVLIDRTLDLCGHSVKEFCGKDKCEIICSKNCAKKLKCSHPCFNKCGKECTVRCKEQCLKTCQEGHTCKKMCYERCSPCEVLIDLTCKNNHKREMKCFKKCSPCEVLINVTCKNDHKREIKCFQSMDDCDVLVEKTLSTCGHTIKIPCMNSSFSYELFIKCGMKCEKTLACSHPCSNNCGDSCVKNCNKPCLKTCEIGHKCKKRCYEKCDSCVTLITKKLVECGHSVKALCGKSEKYIACLSKCERKLKCGHYCLNLCGKPCITICKQLEETVSPVCGHTIKAECHISNDKNRLNKNAYYFLKRCTEQCQESLPCGHSCKGTCGSCYQKRLHVPCREACKRILICGHKCRSQCYINCPPCPLPCENRCIHTKCFKKCSECCIKCKKKCEWSCIHKKCTRPCNERCNREPCNEPCKKILNCKHFCIGFCGEPCPKLCKICDNTSNDSIFFKVEDSARFILLEDCNHVFEVKGLSKWMSPISDKNCKIRMKTCPECKTVIRKNMHYNNVVKESLLQLENVKKVVQSNKENNWKIQSALLQKSVSLTSFVYFPPQNSLQKCLSSNVIRNINELVNIENIISVMSDLINIKAYPSTISPFEFMKALIDYFWVTCKWVTDFILSNFLTISEYQLLQLTYEIYRLRMICKLLEYSTFAHNGCFELDIKNCCQFFLTRNYLPCDDPVVKDFQSAFNILLSKLSVQNIDNTAVVQLPFLKAMNMSYGHWHRCLKGHVYCVTEYVGTKGDHCYVCRNTNLDYPFNQSQSSSDAFIARNSFYQHRYQSSIQQTFNKPHIVLSELRNSRYCAISSSDRLPISYITPYVRQPPQFHKTQSLTNLKGKCQNFNISVSK